MSLLFCLSWKKTKIAPIITASELNVGASATIVLRSDDN
jgi:hypothetical protein